MIRVELCGVCCLFYVAFAQATSKQPWYSTVAEMKGILDSEARLVDELERYIQNERKELEMTKQHLEGMKNFSKDFIEELSEGFKHPIAHYRLLDRFRKKWEGFIRQAKLGYHDFSLNSRFLSTLKTFPQLSDYQVVLNELLQLQNIYNLNTEDLARGKLNGEYSGSILTANECVYLGEEACENGELDTCIEWIDRAIHLVKKGKPCEYTVEYLEKYIGTKKRNRAFKELCAGTVIPSHIEKKLKCYMWDNHREPWLVLQPVKMEYLSMSPDIVRFYDVLTDKEIEILKDLAAPKLARGLTSNDSLKSPVKASSTRVAHNCWLPDNANVAVEKITNRIEKLTGLNMSSAENLQVATYGVSGHYNFHYDWGIQKEYKRKATFMFYLSDVAMGGHTVFMEPEISAKPIKGSAIFWHNLLESGLGDTRTLHAACPVVKGTKWVANKWIRETEEEICKDSEYIGRLH